MDAPLRVSDGTPEQLRELSMRMQLINKVHALQQQMSLLSSHPLLALPEAAELLLENLGLDVVGIYAFADEGPPCAALMAAAGRGAALLEAHAVVRDEAWSSVQLKQAAAAAQGGHLFVPDAESFQAHLPRDYELLHSQAGIRSLATLAVGPPGGAPLGALLLGKEKPGAFEDHWASVWASAAATGLLQHIRSSQVALAARMLRTIDGADDPVAAISVLLQSGAKFMWHATNITMGVRLALVDDSGFSALLFESARASRCRGGTPQAAPLSRSASALLPSDPSADVTLRELPLANTLLASAVSLKKARFVKDCAFYMQNVAQPARDVFTNATEPVASVVVVPLLVNDTALGALYFTQDTACDFSNIQDTLLGFVHCVTLTLHNKLAGKTGMLQGMVRKASKSPGSLVLSDGGPTPVIREIDTSDSEDTASGADASGDSIVPPLTSVSGRLAKVSSRQLCTEAMLKMLQSEIRKGKRRSVELSFVADHLIIQEPIGRGGYGHVYRGSWHKRPAAIKVMNARSTDSEVVSDAMEMAVLSTISHPNIVQVYSCLTDMVEVPLGSSADGSGSMGGPPTVRYRRMLPTEGDHHPTYNIIVMEFMDKGTLADAVRKSKVFHRGMPDGSIGVDLASVIDVLLDVAGSLHYMHRISLLHGDIKLDNILLKTDPLRPLGFVPKLADFGLTKILKDSDHVVNHSGAGTVTHLAPELLVAGSKITPAVDVFAFGVLMWEFYTSKRPYAGLTRDAILERARMGARPIFPRGAPRDYVALATACWSAVPTERPALEEVLARLQQMADGMAAAAAGGQGPQVASGDSCASSR